MFDRRKVLAGIAGAGLLPGTALAQDRRVFTATIMLESNRVLIAVGMNGAGPYIFMIDTGQYVSMVRPDLAKQLGLTVTGSERTSGIAGRVRPFNIYRARDFVIGGGIRQRDVVLQDSFEFGYAQDIYGALSAGILTASDTDLDFDAGELRLYPDGRGERPGYTAVDATIPRDEQPDRGSRKIIATVLLDGRPLRLVLDTGAPDVLMLNQGVARRLGYWNEARPYAVYRPNGIGGHGSVGRIVRAGKLALGGATAERPLIKLLGDTIGGEVDGILGLSFIRRFNLSIDSRARRLWVKPSQQPLVPERYGLSGLWLTRDGAQIVVAVVGTGSPAAAAGLKVGDRIAGEWNATLRAINGPPGHVVTLRRDGGPSVTFTLAAYL